MTTPDIRTRTGRNRLLAITVTRTDAEIGQALSAALPALLDLLDERERLAETSRKRELDANARADAAENALDRADETIERLILTARRYRKNGEKARQTLDRVRTLAAEFRDYGAPLQPGHAADRIHKALDATQ